MQTKLHSFYLYFLLSAFYKRHPVLKMEWVYSLLKIGLKVGVKAGLNAWIPGSGIAVDLFEAG